MVERLEVKQALYRRLDALRKAGSMVSSNTSTIPLALLTEGMPETFKRDFCITHFFNPVRYMRLLEVVAGPSTRPEVVEALSDSATSASARGSCTAGTPLAFSATGWGSMPFRPVYSKPTRWD